MTIPDDPADLAGWLERHLLGLDLATLVAELRAVHGDNRGDLHALLADKRHAVLQHGLSALPVATLRGLLRQPRMLLELQELVLTEGGDHWRDLTHGPELRGAVEQGWKRIERQVAGQGGVQPAGKRAAWYTQPWLVSLATAAAVLVGVFVYQQIHSAPTQSQTQGSTQIQVASTGWGWMKPSATAGEGTPAEYLTRLAETGHEWFDQRPEDKAALAKRIAEMRLGCSLVILAEHKPLAEDDRLWLRARCREWAREFDKNLALLESTGDVAATRAAMDNLVNNLVKTLRSRADAARA